MEIEYDEINDKCRAHSTPHTMYTHIESIGIIANNDFTITGMDFVASNAIIGFQSFLLSIKLIRFIPIWIGDIVTRAIE